MATPPDILDSPAVRAAVSRFSVEEYHRLRDSGHVAVKTELIRGVVIDKMTKSPEHSWLSQFLVEWLRSNLGEGWLVRQEQPLTLKDSEPEPDISVVPGQAVDYRGQHPRTAALVVEVAVSSEEIDQQKASVYAEAGIEEYWIVLAGQRCVQVSREPAAGIYGRSELIGASGQVESVLLRDQPLPIAQLFPT